MKKFTILSTILFIVSCSNLVDSQYYFFPKREDEELFTYDQKTKEYYFEFEESTLHILPWPDEQPLTDFQDKINLGKKFHPMTTDWELTNYYQTDFNSNIFNGKCLTWEHANMSPPMYISVLLIQDKNTNQYWLVSTLAFSKHDLESTINYLKTVTTDYRTIRCT